MDDIMNLPKYSIGVGDRFGLEGAAQLRALQRAASEGVRVVPVWNKSNREHSIIGTRPEDTRRAAEMHDGFLNRLDQVEDYLTRVKSLAADEAHPNP